MLLRLGLMLLALPIAQGSTQTAPSPAQIPMASSAEVRKLIAKAAATIKAGEPVLVQPLTDFAPYRAILEYRQGATGSAVHKREAEVFYVLEGAGTLVVGGSMTRMTAPDPDNLSGAAIVGGNRRRVAAGDFLVVPEGTPHWFDTVDGRLVMIALKVPRGANGRP